MKRQWPPDISGRSSPSRPLFSRVRRWLRAKVGADRTADQAAARDTATALGRREDKDYVVYLTAVAGLTGNSIRSQLDGARHLVSLLSDPGYSTQARALLEDFAEGTRPHVSRRAVAAARRGLDAAQRPMDIPVQGSAPKQPTSKRAPDADRDLAALDREVMLASLRGGVEVLTAAVRAQPWPLAVASVGSGLFGALVAAVAVGLPIGLKAFWGPGIEAQSVNTTALTAAAAVCLAVFAGRAGGLYARQFGERLAQVRLRSERRRAVIESYLRLDYSWHRRHRAEELVATADGDAESAWRSIPPLMLAVGTVVTAIVGLGVLAVIDWRLALLGLCLLALLNLGYLRAVDPHLRTARRWREEVREMAAQIPANRPAGPHGRPAPVRASFREFDHASRGLRDAMIKVNRVRAMFDPVLKALPVVCSLAAFALVMWRPGADGMSAVVGATFLFLLLGSPVRAVGAALAEFPGSSQAFQRIRRVNETKSRMSYGSRLPSPAAVALEFAAVTHGGAAGQPMLDDVSFQVPAGRVVAVVGDRGSGRSMLALLAARRLDPAIGRVVLAGDDAPTLSRDALERVVTYVSARPRVFADSIGGAVSLGRSGVDDAAVWRALTIVGQAQAVRRMTDGLDTPVGGRNRRLSRRMRQLIVLAGAIAGRPRLCVLDDSEDELGLDRTIVEAIRSAVDASILLVTEQPETIKGADAVIYLDRGRLAQAAGHRDLVLKSDSYARLFNDFCVHGPTTDQAVPHPRRDDGRLWQPAAPVTAQPRIDLLDSASEVVRWSTRHWRPRRTSHRVFDVGNDDVANEPARCIGPRRRGARQP